MRLLIGGVMLAGLAAMPVVAQEVMEFTVDGTGMNGAPYSGTATITVLSDTTCEIAWHDEAGGSVGICMLAEDVFSAAYVLNGMPGLALYRVLEDGRLDGVWTIAGMDGMGTEMLTPME